MAASRAVSRLAKWLRIGLVYLLIFIIAGFAGNLWLTRNQASGTAPPIQAQDLQGQWTQVRLDGGEPTLLYFFADWCPICRVQHAAIEAVDENYRVIAIAMQSGSVENVRRYVQQQNLQFEVMNDTSGSISLAYGVHGVPAAFIVDGDGNIRYSTRGYATRVGLILRLWLVQQGW